LYFKKGEIMSENIEENDNIIIRIPKIERFVEWHNGDYTFIVGSAGTGKSYFLYSVREWCAKNSFDHVIYDPSLALESYSLIREASDMDLIYGCGLMARFSEDFAHDIRMWAQTKKYKIYDTDEYMKDRSVLEATLKRCGAGYTKLFLMLLQGIQNPSASYYLMDQPETSLHVHIQRKLINFLMSVFFQMKFVIVTHSPEILGKYMNNKDNKNIISLPEMYV